MTKYQIPNETIEAVIEGLEITEADHVLAISGSGHIPLAISEFCPVSAIDLQYEQIAHLHKLLEDIKNGKFSSIQNAFEDRNLWFREISDETKQSLYRETTEKNSVYFTKERLQKIQEFPNRIITTEGDLFTFAEKYGYGFTKLYLANTLQSLGQHSEKAVRQLISGMQPETIIYSANPFFDTFCEKHPNLEVEKNFEKDEKATRRARDYETELWKPEVVRRI